jgi:hypothetical protein
MFLSETLELDCHSAEHGLVKNYNHALVGLSVRNRSQGERRIKAFEAFLPISEGHLLKQV